MLINKAHPSLSAKAGAKAHPTGQSITTGIGTVLVWGEIDESQTPSYSTISETQTPNWEEVA